MHQPNIIELSEKLLLSVKMDDPESDIPEMLKDLPSGSLQSELNSDDKKKAFWINIYNAYFLILRKHKNLSKPEIFVNKAVEIAGQKFSLDDIEHGILRKYRFKYSLGYLINIFTPKRLKQLAVERIDYRIHFALNCGAVSCPPISFYTAPKIDDLLNLATISFLEDETEVIPDKKEIHISRLFLWYRGDFGGEKGIRKILFDKLKIDSKGFKFKYKEYSWKEHLDNFA